MDLNERLLNHFKNNENKLNDANESNNSKMCAFRQQIMGLHQLGRETSEKTSCDLLEDHLDIMHLHFSKEYIRNSASNIKKLLNSRKNKQTVSDLNFKEEDVAHIEPVCRGVYESCKNMELSTNDFEQFRKCLPSAYQNMEGIGNMSTSEPRTKFSYSNNNKRIAKNVNMDFPQNSIDIKQHQPEISLKEHEHNTNNLNSTVSKEYNSLHNTFRTAREELLIQKAKQKTQSQKSTTSLFNNNASMKKSLGGRRTVLSAFVPPVRPATAKFEEAPSPSANATQTVDDERLQNIDPKMVELIENEIMHRFKPIAWSDIAGLEYAKSIIKEAVVYPLLRPDIFTGLRRPPRGILLFGPPGTGKTLIGKCIASQSNSTFFSISASSLTSKWIGESEKMVRALFAVAAVKQPSVVFIDEIDSLLSQRSDTEHESSRRLKTEFLVQLDGAATSDEDRVIIVGATNRPQELDEAARRRLVRRLYIPLPELEARIKMLNELLQKVNHTLNDLDLNKLGKLTEGYSGADIKSLCHESSMEPIRSIPPDQMAFFKVAEVRPIIMQDFVSALERVRPSVSQSDLKQYTDWNSIYGAAR